MDGTVRPASALDTRLAAELTRIRAADLYRVRRVVEGGHGARIVVDGRACLNFCSNDYLGLAADPRIATAARAALDHGTGSGASALVSGYNREHAALEEELAAFLGRERALLFSSGWAANLGVLRALLGREDRLIADELNHASLIDGGRLAGAQYRRVPHADVAAVAAVLAEPHAGQTLVATDSVFSMDGDTADVARLAQLSRRHGAALMVDDAHGFGVLGGGRGALHAATTPVQADVLMVGFGKALGTAGACVAGSATLVDYLVQRARTWIFSTAPPPPLAAATRAALRIVAGAEGEERRERLAQRIAHFQARCAEAGIVLGAPKPGGGRLVSTTAIQPLVLGAESRALAVSRRLAEQGYWVAAIRPPTVPVGTARLRITLTAEHGREEIDGFVLALRRALSSEVG